MKFEKDLVARSGNSCEISGLTENLTYYLVAPKAGLNADEYLYITKNLADQLSGTIPVVDNDWRCLNDSMWSEVEAVKVVAYRMLTQLKNEGWP